MGNLQRAGKGGSSEPLDETFISKACAVVKRQTLQFVTDAK
jgi:hypothetical protein